MPEFRTKVTAKELGQVLQAYAAVIPQWLPLGDHRALLADHLHHMCLKLARKYQQGKKSYTLKLDGPEALAFYQIWQTVDMQAHWRIDDLARVVIKRITGEMDRQSTSLKQVA